MILEASYHGVEPGEIERRIGIDVDSACSHVEPLLTENELEVLYRDVDLKGSFCD